MMRDVFDVIIALLATLYVLAAPIFAGILWKRGNDYRDLYIDAYRRYLRLKNNDEEPK